MEKEVFSGIIFGLRAGVLMTLLSYGVTGYMKVPFGVWLFIAVLLGITIKDKITVEKE